MEFILNDKSISASNPGGMTLLDFIRYEQCLVGTKIGCREGDCGACTILVGELADGKMKYQSLTSCISPMINASGKHVVTIEGLNMSELSPVQQSMIEANGTQCGFCTVGFVVSLSGYCLKEQAATLEGGISAIDGNICRCTGYKSIERATAKIVDQLKGKDLTDPIAWLALKGFIPDYFLNIPERLAKILATPSKLEDASSILVGGGTDLYVQRLEEFIEEEVHNASTKKLSRKITTKGNRCTIGASATVTDMLESPVFHEYFPELRKHVKLISSTQIRNMGTLAGNFVNASPIGDLTIYFLALKASITLRKDNGDERVVPMKNFYKGYKTLEKGDDEYISDVQFDFNHRAKFNFEKVSKRTNLDIASVNSAISLEVSGGRIKEVAISVGGVGPIPLFLDKTSEYLHGKELTPRILLEATQILLSEISPISDARGTKEYKALLSRQLFYAHFIELFPESFTIGELV